MMLSTLRPTAGAWSRRLLSGLLVLLAVTAPSMAQTTQSRAIGQFADWTAYRFEENGNPVCYMASQPVKAEGNYTRRGQIFAMITHRPAEGSRNVFSYLTGYTYREGSTVEARIGGQTFTLRTRGNTAWTPDAETDEKLSRAIKAGNTMTVVGTSSRGTLTTDTISLRGSTAAHNAISEACGVR